MDAHLIPGMIYRQITLAEYEAEFSTYQEARAAMNELLGGEKPPKMDALKKQRREPADKKKDASQRHTGIVSFF